MMPTEQQIANAQQAANARHIAIAHQATANTYRLLSRLWISEINEELAANLNSDPLRTAYLNAGGDLPRNTSAALEALAYDYCQIFVGPRGHLPPMQSVWRSGSFQDTPAESMREYLDILNLDPKGAIVDHLGIQLQAMAQIVESLATASEETHRRTLERMAAVFFHEHLVWCRPLTEQVTAKADSDFYKSLGRITGNFLGGESERWSISSTDRTLIR